MKKILLFSVITMVVGIMFTTILFLSSSKVKKNKENRETPEEWLYNQRCYPYAKINYNAYFNSLQQSKNMRKSKSRSFSNAWHLAGPVNIGGRVTDIEMPSNDQNTVYAGMASGGIFKSTDQGATWKPIFDDIPTLSIGDIAIDPKDATIIYAGTGEANASSNNGAFPGNGIYKSVDAGTTWSYKGLPKSQNIGRIVIDPKKPDTLFVAAMGQLYGTNPERGVYRSFDGGNTWQQVLFVNDTTGCIDLAINPDSTNIIYAAMWQRIKYPFGGQRCGMGSAIYKSVNGGNTWTKLTNGLPISDANTGRIGIAVSRTNPNIVYASFSTTTACTFNGIYKSTNAGSGWSRIDNGNMGEINNGYGWYFGNIRVDPNNANIVYALGLDTWKSIDGGITWNDITGITHVDHHALCICPQNSNLVFNGNDGGIYISTDAGVDWTFVPTLPITQFYTNEIDYQHPARLYGGAQDNSTSRTMTGNLDDWEVIYGGDGFFVLVDPNDDNYVYAEYQYGMFAKSADGGSAFNTAMNGINSGERMNWNTPVVFDPTNSQTLYYGSNYLYQSTDQASSWTPISSDLTNNNGSYSSITTIAVAPSDNNVIYVGTDDANVWVTQNNGSNWSKISGNLPNRVVTRVAVDPLNAGIAYVTYSGYRYNDYTSQIFRTINYGQNWTGIAGNLPDAPVNDIVIDPSTDSTIFIATDIGVFSTTNLGTTWDVMGDSMPIVPVCNLKLHNPSRILVAATYGRSMYKYNLPNSTSVIEDNVKSFSVSSSPNPFSDYTFINISSRTSASGNIKIFDISGKEITTIYDGIINAGGKIFKWDGTNKFGGKIKKGIYLCRVTMNGSTSCLKIIFNK